MGICWGDPRFPTPSYIGATKSRMTMTISSTSPSESKKTFSACEPILEGSGLTVFTLTQLKAATQDFGGDTFLGEGGFGEVFKGSINDEATSGSIESMIAVKKLKQGSLQGFREWQREIMFLSRLSHPNIVKLLGYCYENKELLLVYEFASKGSLNNHLYGRDSIVPLPWDRRLKIAIGAARGLAFLHTCEQKIIYRNVTPANILLDKSYNARLSDFGLARFDPLEASHLTTSVMGTSGYAAPEYLDTGHLYIKSDVYGFGVVLLELLMGRPVIDQSLPEKKQNLVRWSQLRLPCEGHLVAMMDPRLEGNYSLQSAMNVAILALACVRPHPHKRPPMTTVAEVLEKIEADFERFCY